MGHPGGFFKKLKAKQKKSAARTQRGTKGASKEDRRGKHNDRVVLYAAKREAEQLAVVSSSSDDEASTDSEAEARKANKSMQRLRKMLGTDTSGAAQRKRSRGVKSAAVRSSSLAEREEEEDSWNSSDSERAAETVARHHRKDPQHRRQKRDVTSATTAAGDEEEDPEDWRLYVGHSSDDSAGEEEDAEEGEGSDPELEVLGVPTEDADDIVDTDLLMDNVNASSDEEEEEEEDDLNPLFGLEDGEVKDDDGADLFGDAMLYDGDGEETEGDEEEEEEEKEDGFVDEDEEDPDAGSGEATASDRQLLQSFKFSTSSPSVLQAQTSDFGGSNVLSESDEWVLKYHLDLHGTVDTAPMQPTPVPSRAQELLSTSNGPMEARAAERLARTTDKKQLGLFFVSPEEYATMHPENVAVLASEHAQEHLLHAPFDVEAVTDSSTSKRFKDGHHSASTAAAASDSVWMQCPTYLHPTLWQKWFAYRAAQQKPLFTAEERGLLDLLQGYPDLLDTLHLWQNSESRREIYLLHLLNHWFKARSVVRAHDALLQAKKQERRRRRRQTWQRAQDTEKKAKEGQESVEVDASTKMKKIKGSQKPSPEKTVAEEPQEDEEEEEELELRDRGFSKTRLCVLCPLRNHAYKLVYTLVSILGADPEKCPKLAVFEQDFTEIEEALDPTFRRRPRDYQRAFEGNIDDSFCVGLRLEPERVHVYTHPLNSDILLCSPLGLRRRIEKNGDVLVCLSSIEVCLLMEAQMLFQQNWMHVTAVLELLNKRPTETTHGLSDLRRVYSWALEGRSGRHRQTIMSTEVNNAAILSTFRSTSVNNSGKLLLQRRADTGVLSRVLVPVRQHFIRFDPTSLETVDDDRFHFFTKQVYETKINAMAERDVRVILFVPSYFDFVRMRNYLHREYRESYAAISEYTSLKQQRKALGQFSDLERPVLLVTERFYFFKRYFVKMAEALVFYAPPMFPEYYASLTNRLVATSPNAFTMTVYCRYDTHELNRVVGTSRMVQLLERESGVFSFLTS